MRPTRLPKPGRSESLLLALLAASLVWRLPYRHECLHDDAFISMRYAHHLATGSGLTFNPGERVEGYTNFLWTLLLAACARARGDMVALAPWLSILPALCLPVLVYRFGVRWASLPSRAWALVGAALVAAHPFWLAESVGGLETTLFVLLAFAGFARAVEERSNGSHRGAAAAAFGIATLVRPEGALLFLGWMVWRAADRREPRRAAALGRDAAVYAALVMPLVAFRLAYYGDWVPNTFHAKVGWNLAQTSRGLRYARESGLAVAPLPVLVLAAVGLRGGGWRRLAAWLAGIYALYVVAIGGDFAPTGRFALLPIPFLALLVQSAVARLGTVPGRSRLRLGLALGAVLLAAGWSTAVEGQRLRARHWPGSYRRDLAARRYLGKWLGSLLPQDATVAVGSIGAIGYYSERPILDTFGLTNAEIGRKEVEWMGRTSAGHEKGDADVVLQRAPDVIVFDRGFLAPRPLGLEEFVATARSPTEHLLVEDERFYALYGLRTVPSPVGILHYLERVR